MPPYRAVVFDLDGTLIDSNAAHAAAWALALREHGFAVDAAAVRPLIGMGADKLLPSIAGAEEQSPLGRSIATRKQALFGERLPQLRPTPGARALLEYLRAQGVGAAIATSAGEQEMAALLDRAGLADLTPVRASKDDAAESKPDADIVCAALAKANADRRSAVLVGDTPYDVEAAARAGLGSIALRCGGHWTDRDLRGAREILDDPAALLERWRG